VLVTYRMRSIHALNGLKVLLLRRVGWDQLIDGNGNGKVDTLSVRLTMSLEETRDLWRRVCDFPADLPIEIIQKDNTTYHWENPARYQPTIECTVYFPSTRLNSFLFEGSHDLQHASSRRFWM
jgi:hypothetical protein